MRIVVEEAFVARGPGVLVMPRFVVKAPARGVFEVRLRTPDGGERSAKASMETMHVSGPTGTFAMLRLPELSPQEVPAGTEIGWDQPPRA